jgi:hypothetical protein
MFEFDLKLSNGKKVLWSGRTGEEACQSYADSHPNVKVIAWRNKQYTIQLGFDARRQRIIEPMESRG